MYTVLSSMHHSGIWIPTQEGYDYGYYGNYSCSFICILHMINGCVVISLLILFKGTVALLGGVELSGLDITLSAERVSLAKQ